MQTTKNMENLLTKGDRHGKRIDSHQAVSFFSPEDLKLEFCVVKDKKESEKGSATQ